MALILSQTPHPDPLKLRNKTWKRDKLTDKDVHIIVIIDGFCEWNYTGKRKYSKIEENHIQLVNFEKIRVNKPPFG